MKKLLLILALAVSANAFAQSTMKEDVDIIQGVYGKSKKELVNNYMKIDASMSDAFWKVYDAYEVDRKALGQKKIQIISDYATNFEALTDEKADAIAKDVLKNNLEYDKLHQKYYDKMKAVIGAKGAMKFTQLEIYLETAVRSEIQNAIPFIGEIDKTKPHKH